MLLVSIALTWLLHAPVYAYYSTFMDWTLVPVNGTDHYTWVIDHVSELRQFFFTTAVFCSACCLLMLVLNVLMMVRLVTWGKESHGNKSSAASSNYSRANINLAFSSSIMFAIQFVYLIYICSTALGVSWNKYSQAANSFVGDLMSMSNPFIVLACSKPIQEHFEKFLPGCFSKNIEGTTKTPVRTIKKSGVSAQRY